MDYIKNSTFICGHRRSGTSLLVSLLDFHPELLVYPEDSKFFQHYYPVMDRPDISPEEKIESIIKKNYSYTKEVLYKRCDLTEGYLDFTKLEIRFRELARTSSTWPHMLCSMIKAFAECSPQPKNDIKRWVAKTTSSEIFAMEIDKAFPCSKFIHIVRDPRDNYASLKSGWQTRYRYMSDSLTLEGLRQSCIERGKLGIDMGLKNIKVMGKEKYMIIRYEDLVKNTPTTLKKVAEFLKIDPYKYNMTPSACGFPWKGNSLEGKIFDSTSHSQMGKWKKRIDNSEAALMEFHYKDLMDIFDYPLEFSEKEQLEAASEHYKWLNSYRKNTVQK
ncbi:MAG: sulfotransferase [Candidatus Omnitrophica bacterium]|nr:sulfotransferase [Candidatus Omnitrophota bacterium]